MRKGIGKGSWRKGRIKGAEGLEQTEGHRKGSESWERKWARGNGRAGGKEVGQRKRKGWWKGSGPEETEGLEERKEGQRKLRGYRKERSKEASENEGGAKENIDDRE